VVESVPRIVAAVERLVAADAAYFVPAPGGGPGDVYADLAADPDCGTISRLSGQAMLDLFAERGGDPDRPGKRGRLDPLLWRQAMANEPSWPGATHGPCRPGWHSECAVIATNGLGVPFDVQAGGADLAFPHHEMSTSHLRLLSGCAAPIGRQIHAGLVWFGGHKMSKSLGNLVFVRDLLVQLDPAAARLALLSEHYRSEREWTERAASTARRRLAAWRRATSQAASGRPTGWVIEAIRDALANDLDAPAALAAVDAWAAGADRPVTGTGGPGSGSGLAGGPGSDSGLAGPPADVSQLVDAIDALLGVEL
jgi:L-cysteine:1D-myo-inositol 2-amino-2-deoxy-alpha-D-glucopyranoside ligase